MSLPVRALLAEAQNLPRHELDELISGLLAQRDADTQDTPEVIAAAWDEEISRRVDAMERGEVKWIDGDEALARLRSSLTDMH